MKFNLALLFQHGTSAEDYKKAFELAQAAKKDGFDGAETLVRASEDRYLLISLLVGYPKDGEHSLLRNEKTSQSSREVFLIKPCYASMGTT